MTQQRRSRRADALWRFSLAVYGRPGVPTACLMLQDRHGVDVNLLLYAAWRAVRGEALSDTGCRSAIKRGDVWRNKLVFPLRAVRRTAGTLSDAEPAFAEAYRALKACELLLEREQQAMLADRSSEDETAHADVEDALDLLARVLACPRGVDEAAALSKVAQEAREVAKSRAPRSQSEPDKA